MEGKYWMNQVSLAQANVELIVLAKRMQQPILHLLLTRSLAGIDNSAIRYDFCNPILTRQLVPFQKIEYVLTKSTSRPSHVCDCTSKLRPFNPCESDYVKVEQCKTIAAQFTMHVLMQHIEIWWNLNILCKPVPLPSGCGPQRVSAMMLQNSSG